MRRFYFILFGLYYFSCTKLDVFEIVNTQDPDNPYFLPPPSSVEIDSYDDRELIISFEPSSADTIILYRQVDNDTSIFSFEINEFSSSIIDSSNIILDQEYNYDLWFVNSKGNSIIQQTQTHYHDFPGVDTFSVEQLNETQVRLNWEYCHEDHFKIALDSLHWLIEKTTYNTSIFVDSSIIDTVFALNEECYYQMLDQVELGDSVIYSLQVKRLHSLSDSEEASAISIIFPSLTYYNWIPINSHTIQLEWRLENININYIQDVLLFNNIDLYTLPLFETGNDTSGFYIDDITSYYNGIEAGDNILYKLKWCGIGACDSTFMDATTFPLYNMTYISPLVNVEFSTGDFTHNIDKTDAFYIDLYEVSDDLFNDPGSNAENLWTAYPKDSVNFYEAREYCNNRSLELNTALGNGFQFEPVYSNPDSDISYDAAKVGFHIANELEWEIAASYRYERETGIIIEIYPYPEPVGSGELSCLFANYLGCFGEASLVGYYDGTHYPYQNSTSFSGLYDMSGNLKEWVEKYFIHSDPREILRGGDFMSQWMDCKSTSYIYVNGDAIHRTIGFRTAILAEPFLNAWYEYSSQ